MVTNVEAMIARLEGAGSRWPRNPDSRGSDGHTLERGTVTGGLPSLKGAALFLILGVIGGVGLLSAPVPLQESERVKETGAYDLVDLWPKAVATAGYVRGSQSGVFAESPDRIFLLGRGELKLPDTLPKGFNGTW